MQSKVLLFACLIGGLFLSGTGTAAAQCTGRYLDTLTFAAIDSFQNVIYTTTAGGGVDTELLDVYQPHGDTACLRHLIIWAHGGAFFEGTKNDGDIETLCHHFAQRGYVCASINYRLASSLVDLYDSAQIFKYAYEAFSDFKAAIRYFYKDASQANYWNIDTTAIFIGGSSAGGIATDFIVTLDSVAQMATAFQSIAVSNGGIAGNSGNAGYSTKVIAAASLAGAVNSVSWITPSVPPLVMCQGTADGTVPYDCGLALTQYTLGLYPTINLCGSGEMAPQWDSVGVPYSLLSFPGSGHVPWDTNVVIAEKMDSAVAAFFYAIRCTQMAGHCNEPSGITAIPDDIQLRIIPNPASDYLNVSVKDGFSMSDISLRDYTGREVWRQDAKGPKTVVPLSGLSAGLYVLTIYINDISLPLTRKVVVE